jgi:capsular exopolysaccharide synthesis family protein
MSRLYDTLRRIEQEKSRPGSVVPDPDKPVEVLDNFMGKSLKVEGWPSAQIKVGTASRLVALTDPKSLGAEKFRALVARLENLRRKEELKSLQVTSAVVNEGKSLVAANLAVTLVKHFGYNVFLVEGDLHRPSLSDLFGLDNMEGISHWWRAGEEDQAIDRYIYRLGDMALSFLSAGSAYDQPAHILQSARFAQAFVRLVGNFDWVIVDSTPMSPIVDANLWSRLVNGSLLVVREGVAPIKALKKGVSGLDNPKWIGTVLNEASEVDRVNYTDQYYGVEKKHNLSDKAKKT